MRGQIRVIVADRDRLGECPTWDDRAGRFRWIDVVGKRISSCTPDGGDVERRPFDDFPGSFALREAGGFIVAFRKRIVLFDAAWTEEGSAALVPEVVARERFNDGACDAAGRFFVGTMDARLKEAVGGLYRVDPDLSIHRLTDGIGIGNGIAWSPDGTLLFHCDSRPPIVHVHDYDVATGTVANRRTWLEQSPENGKPDGCAMDVRGHLWMAAPGRGAVHRVDPAGQIVETIDVPARYPSSVAFGGGDLTTLYITTLQPLEGEPAPEDGQVFAIDLDVAGLPCARFAG